MLPSTSRVDHFLRCISNQRPWSRTSNQHACSALQLHLLASTMLDPFPSTKPHATPASSTAAHHSRARRPPSVRSALQRLAQHAAGNSSTRQAISAPPAASAHASAAPARASPDSAPHAPDLPLLRLHQASPPLAPAPGTRRPSHRSTLLSATRPTPPRSTHLRPLPRTSPRLQRRCHRSIPYVPQLRRKPHPRSPPARFQFAHAKSLENPLTGTTVKSQAVPPLHLNRYHRCHYRPHYRYPVWLRAYIMVMNQLSLRASYR
jgi:hypothetical protein